MALDRPDGILASSELPELLDNPNVTTIDGIPRQQLVDLRARIGLGGVAEAVALNSQIHMTLSGLSVGELDGFLNFGEAGFAEALKDPSRREAVMGLLDSADPQVRSAVQSGMTALLEGAEIARVNGVSRALNRMGYVGGLLSFLLVGSQAASAATPEEREQILEDWAVEAVGGEIGAIIGSAVAGIAIAAVGVASAPVSLALVLGASLVGGFIGAEWADDFYASLDGKGEPERARVLSALAELYFGEGAGAATDRVPASDGAFQWIDPQLAAQAIADSAKGDIAWRYALSKLNPFVVSGVDYATIHNADGQLDLFDRATASGMTGEYLLARAQALQTAVALFDAGLVASGSRFPTGHAHPYLDAAQFADGDPNAAVLDLDAASDGAAQRLFGGERDEVIVGGAGKDMLFGGDGADRLEGGAGADYLEGGRGDDLYLTDGGDALFDADGVGTVHFGQTLLGGAVRIGNSTSYANGDGSLRLDRSGGDLQITRVTGGDRLKIRGFSNGDLGISLEEPLTAANPIALRYVGTEQSELILGQVDRATRDFDLVDGFNLPDHIQGRGGRDWIFAWDDGPQQLVDGAVIDTAPDSDIVEGGAGKDFIHGGAGDDRLYATESADADAVEAGRGSWELAGLSDEAGDFVSGQSGKDVLYGGAGADGLFGGDGDDLIHGGGGDDIIAADWQAVISPLWLDRASYDYQWYLFDAQGALQLNLGGYRAGFGGDTVYGGEGDDRVWGGAGADLIYGDAGNDRLNGDMSGRDAAGNPDLPGVYHGNDSLYGGAGDDAINGNGGDDVLIGGSGNDLVDGDFQVVFGEDVAYHGADYLDGGDGADTLSGSGGSDSLLGGDGNDLLFGDREGLAVAVHGQDTLYGDAGDDLLVGQGADDVLHGGSGDDQLYGDDIDVGVLHGNDRLFGGAGADELAGGGGHDTLTGGDDDDSLWGDAGADRLSGGPGVDYLEGGEGADSYVFAAGDSPLVGGVVETVVDRAGEANRIELVATPDNQAIRITRVGERGDLILHYTAQDAVHIAGGLTGSIAFYRFDGVDISYQALLASQLANAHYLDGGATDDLVFGGYADDRLQGGSGDDELHGGDGADTLSGGEARDVIIGGAGDDLLLGGAGSDRYVVRAGDGLDLLDDANGFDVLQFDDAAWADLQFAELGGDLLIGRGADSVTIRDWHSASVAQLRFGDGSVMQIGDALNDAPLLGRAFAAGDLREGVISGTAGADDFTPIAGGAVLRGGAGDDTYWLTPDAAGTLIDDTLGANTLVIEGDAAAPFYLNRDGADLVATLGDVPLARLRGAAANPPARIVFPDGSALSGEGVAGRINDGPQVGSAIAPILVNEDGVLRWRLPEDAFTDSDDPMLRYALRQGAEAPLPGWLSFDPATLMLSGTPRNADVGTLQVEIEATDRGGLQATRMLSIEIVNTNDAPYVVSPADSRIAIAGDTFEIQLGGDVFADIDHGDRLSFQAATRDGAMLPSWLQLDQQTGSLYGTPGDADLGLLELTLSAADAAGASVATTLTLHVERPPSGGATIRSSALAPLEELHFHQIMAAGDVNGDGFEDVLVLGELAEDSPLLSATDRVKQAAYLYYGERGGWGATPRRVTELYAYGQEDAAFAHRGLTLNRYETEVFDLHSKVVLKPLGDLDADGHDDLGLTRLVGGELQFEVLYGSSAGWGDTLAGTADAQRISTTLTGINAADPAAYVRTAETLDWDGDGRLDLLFHTSQVHYDLDSQYYADRVPNIGAAVGLFLGFGARRGAQLTADGLLGQADVWFTDSSGGQIQSLKGIGDVDGDGREDLMIYRTSSTGPYSSGAAAYIVYGGESQGGVVDLAALGPGQKTQLIYSYGSKGTVHALGDVNGDRIDDFVVASEHDLNAVVVFGDPDRAETLVLSGGVAPGAGFSLLSNAYGPLLKPYDLAGGDLNGDGLNEVVLGHFGVAAEDRWGLYPDVFGVGYGTADVILGSAEPYPALVDQYRPAEGMGFRLTAPYSPAEGLLSYYDGLPGIGQVALADIDGDGVKDLLKTAVEAADGSGSMSTIVTRYSGSPAAGGSLLGSEGADSLAVDEGGYYFTRGGDDLVSVHAGAWSAAINTGEGDDLIRLLPSKDDAATGAAARITVWAGAGDDLIEIAVPPSAAGVRLPAGGVYLYGGAGADTYRVSGSGIRSGSLRINDRSVVGQGNSLVLGFGYSASSVRLGLGSLMLGFADDGLEIHLENFDRSDVLGGPRDIDRVLFDDGTTLSYEQLVQRGFDLVGTAGDDALEGTSVVDRLLGLDGNDLLSGGEGNDLLVGGRGHDRLFGGPGDDVYRFARGDGRDLIWNAAPGGADGNEQDALVFDAGIDPEDLWFSRQGNDLLARIVDGRDQIRLRHWYKDEASRVDSIVAGDGEAITADRVEQLVNAVACFDVQSAPLIRLSEAQRETYAVLVAAHWGEPLAAAASG